PRPEASPARGWQTGAGGGAIGATGFDAASAGRQGMRLLSWLIVLALSLVLAACGAPASPASTAASNAGAASAAPTAARPGLPGAGTPAKIRIGYVTLAPNVLPAVWLATDYGLFDKYGLDAELTYIAGSAKIAGALLAG